MRSKENPDMRQFEVSVRLEASNTFRVQAATRKRAEEIALNTAREDAKRLEPLRWEVKVKVPKSGRSSKSRG